MLMCDPRIRDFRAIPGFLIRGRSQNPGFSGYPWLFDPSAIRESVFSVLSVVLDAIEHQRACRFGCVGDVDGRVEQTPRVRQPMAPAVMNLDDRVPRRDACAHGSDD